MENGLNKICDVSHAVERAEKLAKTPLEKAHTKAAVSVIRRIMDTDSTFNPEHTATGHWNFFAKIWVNEKDGRFLVGRNHRFSFEWKSFIGSTSETPLLYNDIYGILQDAANCIWSDEWYIGAAPIIEYDYWGDAVKTQLTFEDGGTVTTKAGTFENCLKLSMDIDGMKDGWAYRGGKKVYYFAEGVGIIRTENEYCDGARTAVYELTSYEGTGDGYMPIADELTRRYDAVGLTDGYIGGVEYIYAADTEGDIVIFKDATGIRKVPDTITQYSSICGEVLENTLFSEGKWQDGHLRHSINNFNLMQHYLFRDSYHFNNRTRSVEICGFNQRLMESFGENGEVPPAWYGIYAWTSLVKSAALLDGKSSGDEGYSNMELAFEYYIKWNTLAPDSLLEVGNREVFGGIKLLKGKGMLELPDGTREAVIYTKKFDYDGLWNALKNSRAWAWFNHVRNEERFKKYIERARKLMESEK